MYRWQLTHAPTYSDSAHFFSFECRFSRCLGGCKFSLDQIDLFLGDELLVHENFELAVKDSHLSKSGYLHHHLQKWSNVCTAPPEHIEINPMKKKLNI